MKAEVDPVLALLDEDFLSPGAPLGKIPWLRTLHSQLNIPVHMSDAPNTPHAAVNSIGSDFIGLQELIIHLDLFVGDHLRLCAASLAIQRVVDRGFGYVFDSGNLA